MNSSKENRNFGIIVGTVFELIGVYKYYNTTDFAYLFASVGTIMILIAIISPSLLTKVKSSWDFIGKYLGVINSTLLLTMVYFLILTPIGLIRRVFKKDPLNLQFDRNANTYWIKRNYDNSSTRLTNQF